jgi:F0F1-type ATP synthase beta subunit
MPTSILGIDELNENDKLGDCVCKIERFFPTRFSFRNASLAFRVAVRGFKCDDLPEQAFMMAGTIGDVHERAVSLAMRA